MHPFTYHSSVDFPFADGITSQAGPFERFARNVMGARDDDDAEALEGVACHKKRLERVNAPRHFADFGPSVSFDGDGLETAAKNALRIYGGSIGRLHPLRREENIIFLLRAGRG